MSGQSWIEATAEQRAELRGLAGSSEREEADRARAILLSLDGWTSERIAAAFCAQPDSVRHWRWIFGREGGSGGSARPQGTGPRAEEGAGCFVGGRGTAGPGRIGSAELDLAAPGQRDREANRRAHLEIAAQRGAEKGGFAWPHGTSPWAEGPRPRHTLKGRQDADAVDRSGLRLRLLKQQAQAGDITLLFGDESEALTHPYLARAWAKRGCDLRVEAPGQSKKRAMIGALDCAARKLIVNTSATKRSSDFIAFLGRLDAIYGPCPARQNKPVVLVLDNGPIHTSKASRAALSAQEWLTVEWLPKYAPELNDIERSWRDLKRHFLAHQTFADADHLDRAIHKGIADMNEERQSPMCANLRIAA
jgi:transposase